MPLPTITCLCPTYGRPRLLANAIACFLAQDYPRNRCKLLICDDLGSIEGLCINGLTEASDHSYNDVMLEVENVSLYTTTHRYNSLPEKYNALWQMSVPSDIYLVFEDDDCQLPWCLFSHAKACEQHGWSYPSHVWSDYGEELHTEPCGGRFHGCLGITGDLLKKLGGWPVTRRADFDQNLIGRLRESGQPGDPLDFCPLRHDLYPATHNSRPHPHSSPYVFRWHTGQHHGQSEMRGPHDESWYDRYQPPDRSGQHTIIPAFDDDTKRFYDLLTR